MSVLARILPLILVVAGFVTLPGCVTDDRPRISIEFGADPELFEGKEVTVDEMVVGKLEKTGQATRISFPVEVGVHEVCVDVPDMTCQPYRVDLQRGMKVRLLAVVGETTDEQGHPTLTFQPM